MNQKKLIIRKISLKKFLSLLTDIYNSGADFIDLHGMKNDREMQDEVTVSVPLSYMSPESKGDFTEDPLPPPFIPPPPPPIRNEKEKEITRKEFINMIKYA